MPTPPITDADLRARVAALPAALDEAGVTYAAILDDVRRSAEGAEDGTAASFVGYVLSEHVVVATEMAKRLGLTIDLTSVPLGLLHNLRTR